jgi:UDPglucose 6-dehydrogenase
MGNKINKKIITFLGVTFKPNTDDMREASSLKMIPWLIKKGAYIRYHDPSGIKKEFKKYKHAVFCKDISKACLKSDLVIIHTEWNEFKTINFKKTVKKKNFKIYDMRNIYSPIKMKKKNIKYFSIGR